MLFEGVVVVVMVVVVVVAGVVVGVFIVAINACVRANISAPSPDA